MNAPSYPLSLSGRVAGTPPGLRPHRVIALCAAALAAVGLFAGTVGVAAPNAPPVPGLFAAAPVPPDQAYQSIANLCSALMLVVSTLVAAYEKLGPVVARLGPLLARIGEWRRSRRHRRKPRDHVPPPVIPEPPRERAGPHP